MEEKKTVWEIVKANWFWFLASIVVALWAFWVKRAADFAVIFNDWVKCKMMALPCLNSRWEVIKFIGCGIIIGVLLLFITVMLGRRIARIENSGMKKAKIFWKEYVVSSWQIVRKVLVIGFLFFVGAVGLFLFALLIAVLFDACIECWAKIVLGISEDITKQDVIEFIGWGITGILAFFGAVAINSRADAQVQIAKAEVENNKLIEKGHIQERFKTAVKNLESEHKTVRITPFYDFYHLARDNNDMRQHIFNILCAHLQQIIFDDKYEPKAKFMSGMAMKPTKEVQDLLNTLFLSKDGQEEFVFAGLKATLREIFLVEANLHKANLQNAVLYKANLWGANLQEAKLRNASLQVAELRIADLRGADLYKASLWDANLQGANLREANLQGANLCEAYLQIANLQGANLREAYLQGANLHKADLHKADLYKADLYKANLSRAKLRDVKMRSANLQDADLQSADLRDADLRGVKNLETANLSGAKVKGANFSGQWPEGVIHD